MKINIGEIVNLNENPVICHCFGYTLHDLQEDFSKNGKSLIAERILAEKRLGGCQCASKNPSGK